MGYVSSLGGTKNHTRLISFWDKLSSEPIKWRLCRNIFKDPRRHDVCFDFKIDQTICLKVDSWFGSQLEYIVQDSLRNSGDSWWFLPPLEFQNHWDLKKKHETTRTRMSRVFNYDCFFIAAIIIYLYAFLFRKTIPHGFWFILFWRLHLSWRYLGYLGAVLARQLHFADCARKGTLLRDCLHVACLKMRGTPL